MRRGLMRFFLAVCALQVTGLTSFAEPAAEVLEAPASQQTQVRIIERYGAAIREDPVADSPILVAARCNETYLQVGTNGPWRQIFSVVGTPDELTVDEEDDIFGWVHSDHVDTESAPALDCANATPHRVGATVESFTDGGCLPLKAEASPSAGDSECRPDGVRYEVVSGPTSAGGEEWIEVRPVDGGASGWARGLAVLAVP